MVPRKCESCGAELDANASGCAVCGTPLPAIPDLVPAARPNRRPVKSLFFVVACLLVGSLIVIWAMTRHGEGSSPKVTGIANLAEIRAKADQGDAEAQKKLGAAYARGQGLPQDYKEAAKWYRQAADQGHAGAQTALGELFEAGQGVPRDETQAAKCYRQA